MVCQRFPELAVDERYDAAGVFWCAAMILAMLVSVLISSIERACIALIDETDLAYSPPLLSAFCSICACMFHVVWLAYLPEATDVVLNIAWDPEIWLQRL
jgi:flagellar biosynthesis protein FliQ